MGPNELSNKYLWIWNFIMPCLETMISFENLELAQIIIWQSKLFKFEFRSNFIMVFKVIKVENLRMNTQILSFSNSFSNSSFIIS